MHESYLNSLTSGKMFQNILDSLQGRFTVNKCTDGYSPILCFIDDITYFHVESPVFTLQGAISGSL